MTASTTDVGRPAGLALLLAAFAAALGAAGIISVNALAILIVLAALGAIVLALRAGSFPAPDPLATALVLALLAWAAVSTLWAPAGEGRARLLVLQVGVVLLSPLVLAAAARSLEPVPRRLVARFFLVGIAFAVAFFLIDRASGLALTAFVQQKPVQLVDLNRSASFLAIGAWPAAAALWVLGRRRLAILLPIAFEPLLLLFHNETAKLGLPIGLAAALLTAALPRFAAWLGLFALIPLVLLYPWTARLLYATGIQDVWPIFLTSLEHRMHIWAYTSDLARAHAPLGMGFDASRHLSEIPALAFNGPARVRMSLHPHNAAMQIWLELGVVGIALATALVVLAGFRLARLPRPMRPFAAGFLATTAPIVLISYGIWQERWLATFLCLGLVLVLVAPLAGAPAGGAGRITGSSGSPRRPSAPPPSRAQ